jgi:hypothetical protein
MVYFYSKSTGGFYLTSVHKTMPADVVEVSEDTHTALMAAQTTGKQIVADANGNPIAADPAPLTGNALIEWQISMLEMSITPRMLQEAASGSVLTGLGSDKTQTATQYIANVRTQIETLRTQLTK